MKPVCSWYKGPNLQLTLNSKLLLLKPERGRGHKTKKQTGIFDHLVVSRSGTPQLQGFIFVHCVNDWKPYVLRPASIVSVATVLLSDYFLLPA